MAIDQGTTGSRVLIVDKAARIVSSAYSEFEQIFPEAGWVEHDAETIWDTTQCMMHEAMDKKEIGPDQINGIGITNQRETVVLWDRKTLKPVYNAIVWQCRRSSQICEDLKAEGLEPKFREKTGLVLDAYFSGTKVKWLFDKHPELLKRARAGELALGTMDTWIIAQLTRGKAHVTDYTNASRTLMFNIHEKKWDKELLDLLGIPEEILPKVVDSCGIVAESDPEITGAAIPIAGIAGDQQASLFGQGCFYEGEAKNTYGTGSFILKNIGDKKTEPKGGLLLTLACNENGKPCYALEGAIFITGAVVQWLRDGIGLIDQAQKTQALAMSVKDTLGVYMVPAFAGLGAPYWDMYARGAILGITRGTKKAHIIRAALESICYQVKDLGKAFEEATGDKLCSLQVDGGASKNDFIMQFQADILNCSIDRSVNLESTGMGAAFLAGIATGFWEPGQQIKNLRQSDRIFYPKIDENKRNTLYEGWKDAVSRVRSNR